MEEFKNLKEIIELSEEEINNNDDNVSAILDLEDLKELRNLIARYKELEKHYQHEQEYINGEVFSAKQMHYIEDNYIDKSKVKEILDKYKYTEIGDTDKIIEFYKKIQELLEES